MRAEIVAALNVTASTPCFCAKSKKRWTEQWVVVGGGECPAVYEQKEQSRTTDCPHGQMSPAVTVSQGFSWLE